MTAGAPWSVKGIDPKAREVAKDHARRSGMTLGEWLNRVILEDESGEAAYAEPRAADLRSQDLRNQDLRTLEPAYIEQPPRPRLVAETPGPRADEVARIAHALDRLTDRIEASETRTGLAITSVEHSVRQAVARIEASEREGLAVATRFEGGVDRVSGEQARLAERLRRMESEAAGPRSTEALRAIEQSVSRVAGQLYESEARSRETLMAMEARLARAEAAPAADPAPMVEEIVQRLGRRLADAEGHTAEALETLRKSMAALDGRLRTVETGRSPAQEARFEALAQSLTEQVSAARAQVAERLQSVDAGRVDRRFAELAREVEAGERRSAQAIQRMGREVLSMADAVNRRLETSEERNAETILQMGGEMARVAGSVEERLARAEQTQAEALERLSAELGRITDRLSERLLVSERRAAEAIDDVGEQVARVTDRMEQRHEQTVLDLVDQIRQSEGRTAQLLEETRERLEHRLSEAPAAPPPLAAAPDFEFHAPAPEAAPQPSAAAFGPDLFLRAEEVGLAEDELELAEAFITPAAARDRFQAAETFAPIPEPEEDLFGLDQPEPPADAETSSTLSTREVIEQARAAARAAAPPETAPKLQVKAKASWRAGGKAPGRGLFSVMRPKRTPGSTLQTAIMVAGGAAFLSVGAAGVVLMQGPPERKTPEAIEAQPARAAVALAPQALGAGAPGADAAEPRPPAQLADALLTAYASAVKGIEAGEPGALARLKAIAEAGQPAAQLYLGKLYETGEHGVRQNLVEARRWTARAAEGGDPAAMHNLALFLFRGEGGARDLQAAGGWFRKAAEQGVADSQFNLGLLLESGSGAPQNLPEAYKWFSIAAASGDAQARSNAAQLQPKLSAQQRAAADEAVAAFIARPPGQARANTRLAAVGR